MATKKKAKMKDTKSKRTVGKKVAARKKAVKKKLDKKRVQVKSQSVDTVAFALEGLGAQSGEQSGDLQGLSNVQGADSESVDELLGEGNAFEADGGKGVEDAGDADAGQVRTRKGPQGDGPGQDWDS